MNVGLVEIVDIVIMFQLLIFSIFLFIRKVNKFSNYLLGIQLLTQAIGLSGGFCFYQAAFFLKNFPHVFFIGFPFMFLWGPTFYLYVRSAAYKDFKFILKDILHLLPFSVVLIFLLITFFPLSAEEKRAILNSGFYFIIKYQEFFNISVRIQVLLYILASIKIYFSLNNQLKESFSSNAKTNLSFIRFLIGGFAICFILNLPVAIYMELLQGNDRQMFILIILPYFVYFNILFFKGWLHPELFIGIEEPVKYKSSKLTESEAETLKINLNNYITDHKPFLNPELTLSQLADYLNTTPRILSQLLNEYHNKNFYDYINNLRVEESKKLLKECSGNKNILEILFDAGFNSKATFNRVFKKETGLSPTEYRKAYSAINVPTL